MRFDQSGVTRLNKMEPKRNGENSGKDLFFDIIKVVLTVLFLYWFIWFMLMD